MDADGHDVQAFADRLEQQGVVDRALIAAAERRELGLKAQVDQLEQQGVVDRALIAAAERRELGLQGQVDQLEQQGVVDRALIAAGERRVHGLAGEVSRLERSAEVDRQLIAQLQAEGVVERANVAHLEYALGSARRIGAAIGILMAAGRLTEPQAFDVLRTVSQNTNRKLREIAEDVVETGTLPTR